MNNIFDFWKKIFAEIGVKKFWLSFHYGLAIITSLSFFVMCVICTLIPQTIDVGVLTNIYKIIMIYCGVIVAFITIKCIFEDLADSEKKIDWIAAFIGLSMLITLGIIIACIIFMFKRVLTDIERQMWGDLIKVFGGMFITQAGGGFIYNIFKKKSESKAKVEEEEQEPQIALYTNEQEKVKENPPE